MLETTYSWLVGPGCWWAGVKGDIKWMLKGRRLYHTVSSRFYFLSSCPKPHERPVLLLLVAVFSVSIAPEDSSSAYLVYSGRVYFAPGIGIVPLPLSVSAPPIVTHEERRAPQVLATNTPPLSIAKSSQWRKLEGHTTIPLRSSSTQHPPLCIGPSHRNLKS